MIHPIRDWNRFFFGLTSARPLGVLRIGFGLLALVNLAFCAVELDHWYTDAGLLRGDEAKLVAGAFIHSPLQYLQSPLAARVAFGFTALAALGLTVGWRTKLMSILFYGGMLSIHGRNTVSSSGADVLLLITAFNLMLSPCGAALSIDARRERRRRGTEAEPVVLLWPLRLLQFQISLVYALAALLKFGGNLWLNGTAIHYVLHNTEVRRLDLTPLAHWEHYPLLINAMTYSALTMEVSLAFFIWVRGARPYVFLMGFALHLGIMATVNIPIFGELMWVGYLAFLTPPEYFALARAVDVRRWFGRRAGATELAGSTPAAGRPVVVDVPHATTPVARPRPVVVADDSEFDFDAESDSAFDFAQLDEPVAEPAAASGRSPRTRVDGPGATPPPHRSAPTATPTGTSGTSARAQTAREFAEASMDPWDSFQILM